MRFERSTSIQYSIGEREMPLFPALLKISPAQKGTYSCEN